MKNKLLALFFAFITLIFCLGFIFLVFALKLVVTGFFLFIFIVIVGSIFYSIYDFFLN